MLYRLNGNRQSYLIFYSIFEKLKEFIKIQGFVNGVRFERSEIAKVLEYMYHIKTLNAMEDVYIDDLGKAKSPEDHFPDLSRELEDFLRRVLEIPAEALLRDYLAPYVPGMSRSEKSHLVEDCLLALYLKEE